MLYCVVCRYLHSAFRSISQLVELLNCSVLHSSFIDERLAIEVAHARLLVHRCSWMITKSFHSMPWPTWQVNATTEAGWQTTRTGASWCPFFPSSTQEKSSQRTPTSRLSYLQTWALIPAVFVCMHISLALLQYLYNLCVYKYRNLR